ncbi:MAG: hypothetical protein ACRDNZ_17795, partial [Streptosporangiaceae bacterium]
EALWGHLLAGELDWVTSDHACCKDEAKFGEPRDDVFVAKSGFGGTEYLQPGLITEGAIEVGYDADFALVDPDANWVVAAADSESAQGYTPFEGFKMTARVTDTFVRGNRVLEAGRVTGQPSGSSSAVRHPGAAQPPESGRG